MDSVSKHEYDSSLVCPYAKIKNKEDEFRLIQFGKLPTLSKSSLSSSFHLRSLDLGNNKDNTYTCQVCYINKVGASLYSCKECPKNQAGDYIFHKKCIEPISKHPYHPKHLLRFIRCPWWEKGDKKQCLFCLRFRDWNYDCSICDFTICEYCVKKPPLLAIDRPKRHEHNLVYFPRKGVLICDVCALADKMSLMYSCLQCDFIVHKDCVYLPSIIRISRHEHRICFTSSLTPENWSCGVCRGKIDTNYGRYTCMKSCNYGVHSKCATREDVWDGLELEGKPEPEDAYEDIKPFHEIGDGIIKHFCHQNHHMRLDEETNRAFDENKRCQACTLPIYEDIIYNCMQCDFILHQDCAHLPRKKRHAMHPHPLSLTVEYRKHYKQSWFRCNACSRFSNGFMYVCPEDNCFFMLDVCCASIDDILYHRCHPHPLFLTFKPKSKQTCSLCLKLGKSRLNCGDCDFVLCFECGTLPNKLRYKHDEHFVIPFYGEDASGQYLCDICEKEANPKSGIYICNDCNVSLHLKCLLGEDMYMIHGGIIKLTGKYIYTLPNNRLTRNICKHCHNRCENKIVYKISDREIFCSLLCVYADE